MNGKRTDAFKSSLSLTDPPENISEYARALWYAGKGNWEKAHNIIQEIDDKPSARIHAFLHRQEGDLSNAGYWYKKAGEQIPAVKTDEEWEQLVSQFV
ncbi:MAG: hypothetical protein M3N30_00685 [Bacteroidota bacterium]|nr:hypothetical protein [Bacteroidota bacterium]